MGNLTVSTSPHIRSSVTTQSIMRDVLIALAPATTAAVVFFGLRALLLILVSVSTCFVGELLFNLICRRKQTVGDLSAIVTGVILALNVNTKTTIWQMIIGALFAIVVVKCLFGGLGCNFANPAATARVLLCISFAEIVSPVSTNFTDLVAGATPLDNMAKMEAPLDWVTALTGQNANGVDVVPKLFDMFIGNRGGAMGETCALAILAGFVYLLVRRIIKWQVPTVYVATVFVLSWILGGSLPMAIYYVLSGGLLFAAVFMATDYVTTPLRTSGKIIFALGCAVLTVLIRFFGGYPEGVSFSILIMNILTPFIDKLTAKVPFGGKRK